MNSSLFYCFLKHIYIYEKQWIEEYQNLAILFYKRYVDDIFCLVENETFAEDFLSYLNSKHPNIKFTMEIGKENKLSFLDIHIYLYIYIYIYIDRIYEEIQKLKCLLSRNKYPLQFINFCIMFFLNIIIVGSQPKVPTVSKKEFNICLPFLGKETLIVNNKLRRLFASQFPAFKLRIDS